MSKHTPYVEEVMENACVYGEHEHPDDEDCPITSMVACEGCVADAVEDDDGLIRVTAWPCNETTRTGREDDVIARLPAPAVTRPEGGTHA